MYRCVSPNVNRAADDACFGITPKATTNCSTRWLLNQLKIVTQQQPIYSRSRYLRDEQHRLSER